ncbi:respiratory nitrate reductase subunit gamma [Paludifilum halophilum]|uniref:Respiratory nitrate reductase subunit gamma n=1 Tax=Paludifilum halophilum TaxID=1642702 RepID=A0A235B333_9BACL|nr:respiratory nitrate reductase subunit gamma [Paludifilum halophilum]OYD06694.1 respiratory nitrate reductase subunit gamma [Paludifilum halophilum]
MWEQFLWVIYPYLVITVFIVGHLYRLNNHPFSWTSKSSEFLEKRVLKWGSTLFHWGILFVVIGHVAGLLVPVSVYRALGVSDEAYHVIALSAGGIAGLAALLGALLLMGRRFRVKRVRATSSVGDLLVIVLLVIILLTGLTATGTNVSHTGFDYRTTINPWIRGILTFRPDASLMEKVPVAFKIHILLAFGLFAVWPFTRLVHVFSLPITYLSRSYVVYRRHSSR